MNRNEMICLVVALVCGAAVIISSNFEPVSPEMVRVRAFKQCMNTMGTTEEACRKVVDGK
jgi:hypothetical protein